METHDKSITINLHPVYCKVTQYYGDECEFGWGSWVNLYKNTVVEIGKFTRNSSGPIYKISVKDVYLKKELTKDQKKKWEKAVPFLKEFFPSLYKLIQDRVHNN